MNFRYRFATIWNKAPNRENSRREQIKFSLVKSYFALFSLNIYNILAYAKQNVNKWAGHILRVLAQKEEFIRDEIYAREFRQRFLRGAHHITKGHSQRRPAIKQVRRTMFALTGK